MELRIIFMLSLIGLFSTIIFINAYAIDNNCLTNVWNFFELPIALGCIEDRIDSLENAPSGGEVNTASCDAYLYGECLFAQKSGVDLQFKKLMSANGALLITSNSSNVIFNNTASGESTVCNNLGTVGEPICIVSSNVNLKKLLAGSGITLTSNGTRITISATGVNHNLLSSTHSDTVTQTPSRGSLIYGDSTPLWNELVLGTASKNLRSDGTDSSWSWDNVATLAISTTLTLNQEVVLGDATTGSRIFTLPVCNSGNTGKHYTIVKIDSGAGTIAINGDGSDTVNGVVSNYLITRAFEGISIYCNGANGWTTMEKNFVGQTIQQVWRNLPKTNIGTTLVNVYYSTAFDEEHLTTIDCKAITDFRILYLWDYIGSGTHTLQWVDVSAPTGNILYSVDVTVDQDVGDSGWFTKDSLGGWCVSNTLKIKWMAKSTTGTDDPIAYGYRIMVR